VLPPLLAGGPATTPKGFFATADVGGLHDRGTRCHHRVLRTYYRCVCVRRRADFDWTKVDLVDQASTVPVDALTGAILDHRRRVVGLGEERELRYAAGCNTLPTS